MSLEKNIKEVRTSGFLNFMMNEKRTYLALSVLIFLLIPKCIWMTKNTFPVFLIGEIDIKNLLDFENNNVSYTNAIILKFGFLIFPFILLTIFEIIRNKYFINNIKLTSLYRIKESKGSNLADVWYFILNNLTGKIGFLATLGTLGIANIYKSYNEFIDNLYQLIIPGEFNMDMLIYIFISSLLLGDFVSYWAHRISHKYFWELHEFHHSATEMTMLSYYRLGLIESFTVEAPLVPLRILSVILITKSLSEGQWIVYNTYIIYNIILQLFIYCGHGSTKILFPKPLSYIFLSPSLHWLHHSDNPNHYDSNFGTIFCFWDRIFGTYLGEEHLKDITGFGDPNSQYNKYHPLYSYFIVPIRKLSRKYRKMLFT